MTTALPHIRSFGFSCRDAETLAGFFERHLGFRRGATHTINGGPYAELISLPMFHSMSSADIDDVVTAVRKVMAVLATPGERR